MGLGTLVILALFLFLFEILPVLGILSGTFLNNGSFSIHNLSSSWSTQYRSSFLTSTYVSLISALIGLVLGVIAALAISREKNQGMARVLESFSALTANFAGVPLAFAFMVSLGANGVYTNLLHHLFGINIYAAGFSLLSITGLVIVYSNFQIPLTVLLILPAVLGLRQEWLEAHQTLGGSRPLYWWKVAFPILLPPALGVFALLFANSFGAYVTAYALAAGTINLVPVQIGFLINGNVGMNIGVGDALSMDMIVVMLIALFAYRWSLRWTAGWR
jgi:putative spermidine/putrescine transport system permease protein